MICLKSERELETMDRANHLVHEVLRAVEEAAGPGVSTGELDRLAEEMIRAAGGGLWQGGPRTATQTRSGDRYRANDYGRFLAGADR